MSMTKSCLGQLILTLKLPCWHRSGLQSNSSQWFYVKHTWSSELSAFSHQCQQWTRHNINKSHGSPRCCTGSACNTGLIIMYILCYCYADIFGESYYHYCNSAGAGIAQWLEHRTRDWKVAGSNPCWNGRRIFFSRVDFLCWLLTLTLVTVTTTIKCTISLHGFQIWWSHSC